MAAPGNPPVFQLSKIRTMNFLIFLSGESRTPFIDVSGHSGRQYRFFYDEANKCMALDGKESSQARLAEVSEDLIGVKGCFKVHLKCVEAPAEVKPAEDDKGDEKTDGENEPENGEDDDANTLET